MTRFANEFRSTGTKVFDNTVSVTARNAAFVAGDACPTGVNGATIATSNNARAGYPDQTYLLDAIEIASPNDPGYTVGGNHDGLCESGES